MPLTLSREERKKNLRLSISSELASLKEKTKQFEKKYSKNFTDFIIWMKLQDENFEIWSDYLEWNANERFVQELTTILMDLEKFPQNEYEITPEKEENILKRIEKYKDTYYNMNEAFSNSEDEEIYN